MRDLPKTIARAAALVAIGAIVIQIGALVARLGNMPFAATYLPPIPMGTECFGLAGGSGAAIVTCWTATHWHTVVEDATRRISRQGQQLDPPGLIALCAIGMASGAISFCVLGVTGRIWMPV